MVDQASKAKAEKRSIINITAPCHSGHNYRKIDFWKQMEDETLDRETDPARLVGQADLKNKRPMLDTIDRHIQCLSLSSTSTG